MNLRNTLCVVAVVAAMQFSLCVTPVIAAMLSPGDIVVASLGEQVRTVMVRSSKSTR